MSGWDCPCGFGLRAELTGDDAIPFDLETFSAEWHRMHMAHHLATFPNVDQGTRDNLDMFVRRAELREVVSRAVVYAPHSH